MKILSKCQRSYPSTKTPADMNLAKYNFPGKILMRRWFNYIKDIVVLSLFYNALLRFALIDLVNILNITLNINILIFTRICLLLSLLCKKNYQIINGKIC